MKKVTKQQTGGANEMARLRDQVNDLHKLLDTYDVLSSDRQTLTDEKIKQLTEVFDQAIGILNRDAEVNNVEERNGILTINLPWTIVFQKNDKEEWYWENKFVKLMARVFHYSVDNSYLDVTIYPQIYPIKKVSIKIVGLTKFQDRNNELIVTIPSYLKKSSELVYMG